MVSPRPAPPFLSLSLCVRETARQRTSRLVFPLFSPLFHFSTTVKNFPRLTKKGRQCYRVSGCLLGDRQGDTRTDKQSYKLNIFFTRRRRRRVFLFLKKSEKTRSNFWTFLYLLCVTRQWKDYQNRNTK